jgi:hypothetical protein
MRRGLYTRRIIKSEPCTEADDYRKISLCYKQTCLMQQIDLIFKNAQDHHTGAHYSYLGFM